MTLLGFSVEFQPREPLGVRGSNSPREELRNDLRVPNKYYEFRKVTKLQNVINKHKSYNKLTTIIKSMEIHRNPKIKSKPIQ